MDLTGKIKNLAVDYFSKKITVTLEINEAERFIKGVDELKKLEKLSVIIKPFRKKRSLSANAYFHVLVTKIAEKVGTSKAEAKNLMIGRYGQPELIKGDIAVLKTNVPTNIMYKKEDIHTVAIGRRLEKRQRGSVLQAHARFAHLRQPGNERANQRHDTGSGRLRN